MKRRFGVCQAFALLVFSCLVHAQPSICPIGGFTVDDISLDYGVLGVVNDTLQKPHNGIDFLAMTGTPVLATGDGIVVSAKISPGHYGNYVKIKHGDLFETFYAHLSGFEVQEGEYVAVGQIIGYVGQSGLAHTPNLHYEVRKSGRTVNPIEFIQSFHDPGN